MKTATLVKLIIILLLLPIFTGAQDSGLDLGIRYLKLSNTYREQGSLELAAKYLEKGRDIVSRAGSWSARYWQAVADEYSGYMYKKMAARQSSADNRNYFLIKAKESLQSALAKYKQLIEMPEGSQEALKELVQTVDGISRELYNESGAGLASTGLDILNYDNMKLRDLPSVLPEDAKNISLANNKLRDFPGELTRMKGLTYLNLSGNRLRSLPGTIGELTELHWLDLSNNRMRDIEQGLGKLQNLKELDLSDNRIRELPADLSSLKNLSVLNLRNNDIPFEQIANLIRDLPNTNIMFDKYELQD
ncbi:MAG: leucine-rich repeat domain-containing protein [Candidatus Kapaibacterium sp.]